MAEVAVKAMPYVYTVSQLAAELKSSLERGFRSVDLEGEISNWRRYPSGHAYFVVKDSGAALNAVLFASVPCDCRDRLGDGKRVKIRAQATMYTQRGELQLKVTRIKIAGEGELMAKYLALKAKLEAEGLFAHERKRLLPYLPKRVALVTSPAGAVVHDMCRVLMRRFPAIEIRLYPCAVQGADAARTVTAGIDHFSRAGDGWRPDVAIVARGGGSFEDLFPFNDENLVRAIAASPFPVISAVGHETDVTLCDFVADVRAGTPSMAAELAVPVAADLKRRIDKSALALAAALRARGEAAGQHIDRLGATLASSLRAKGEAIELRIDRLETSLVSSLRGAVELASKRIELQAPALERAVSRAVDLAEARLEMASSALVHLSPYGVLERGYSLTVDTGGRVVTDSSTLKSGDSVTTRLARGEFTSTVACARAGKERN